MQVTLYNNIVSNGLLVWVQCQGHTTNRTLALKIGVLPVILKLIAVYVVRFPIEVMAATDTMYSKLGATSCSVTLVLEVFTVV